MEIWLPYGGSYCSCYCGPAMVFSTLGVLMVDPLGQTPARAVIGLGAGVFVLFLLYERGE